MKRVCSNPPAILPPCSRGGVGAISTKYRTIKQGGVAPSHHAHPIDPYQSTDLAGTDSGLLFQSLSYQRTDRPERSSSDFLPICQITQRDKNRPETRDVHFDTSLNRAESYMR